jgi:hypothetical protein
MSFFKNLFTSRRRKEKIQEFGKLVNEVKRISSVHDCGLAMKAVIKFREGLDENDPLNGLTMNLAEFIIDTRNHAKDGHHKTSRTNWQTKREYPDINDYFKFGFKISKY